jgi:hypothetical protein
MQLTLSDDDARTLRNLLRDVLPDLRREAAHTDLPARELRHELHKRQDLCERLVTELERSAGPASGGAS